MIKIKSEFLERSYVKGLSLFVIDLILLVCAVSVALAAESVALRFTAAVLAGLIMSLLFLVGHDADHGSLTNNRRTNRLLGTIAFLPVLHPYNLWVLVHHHHHHRYTNLAGEDYDYVWAPYSKADFDALPKSRQILERVYRSPIGHGAYYMIEIWWKRMFFPRRRYVGGEYRKAYVSDMVVLAAFLIIEVVTIVALALSGTISQPWWSALIFAIVIPHLVWNWYVGFFTLLQHNHPDIRWYDNIEEWKKESRPPGDTAHFVFPRFINFLAHGVDEHGGHHLSPNIPLYNLGKVQSFIETEHPGTMPTYRWTPSTYMKILKHCRLYDYRAQQWLDFDGCPSQRSEAASPTSEELSTAVGGNLGAIYDE
jgi:acyl-lipid omega-6 desaturase (Delta-12 desaturase)